MTRGGVGREDGELVLADVERDIRVLLGELLEERGREREARLDVGVEDDRLGAARAERRRGAGAVSGARRFGRGVASPTWRCAAGEDERGGEEEAASRGRRAHPAVL